MKQHLCVSISADFKTLRWLEKHNWTVRRLWWQSTANGLTSWRPKDSLVSPEVDWAHRVLTAKPQPRLQRWPVIIHLHRLQTKEMIIREACKRRGSLQYWGTSVHIYKDYTPEVLEQLLWHHVNTVQSGPQTVSPVPGPTTNYTGKRSQKEDGAANCQQRPDVEAD